MQSNTELSCTQITEITEKHLGLQLDWLRRSGQSCQSIEDWRQLRAATINLAHGAYLLWIDLTRYDQKAGDLDRIRAALQRIEDVDYDQPAPNHINSRREVEG